MIGWLHFRKGKENNGKIKEKGKQGKKLHFFLSLIWKTYSRAKKKLYPIAAKEMHDSIHAMCIHQQRWMNGAL